MAQEAQATIEKVQKARAFCERDLPARVRETERLRTALTQAESYQNDLEREFARSSWQAVARNLDQARSLLATFDRQAQQAAAAATTTRQEYLNGAAVVEELARQQQIVLRLMSGLGEQLNALINVRNECRKLNEDLAARERQAELLIRQNDPIVSDVARNSLESARRAKAEIIARSGAASPRLARAAAEPGGGDRGPVDRPIAGRGRRQAPPSAHPGIRAGPATRPAASMPCSPAIRKIAWRPTSITRRPPTHSTGSGWSWPSRGADRPACSNRCAAPPPTWSAPKSWPGKTSVWPPRPSPRSPRQARPSSQARGYSSMGLVIDTSSAESQVMQAQQLLQTQNYEQSIQLAGAAMQSARQIYYAAMQQVLMQQAAMAAEQRRQSVRMAAPAWNGVSFGAAAATAAAAVILDNAGLRSASRPPEPADAVGSWSSDTGQGSW